jgi:hypothetical protein
VLLVFGKLEIKARRIGFKPQVMETFIVDLDSHVNNVMVCTISKRNKHVSRQAEAKAAGIAHAFCQLEVLKSECIQVKEVRMLFCNSFQNYKALFNFFNLLDCAFLHALILHLIQI